MPSQRNLYFTQLTKLRLGFPLHQYSYASHNNVPIIMEIGDVGYLYDGTYRRLFNITKPPDHPFNQTYGVPDGFEQFNLEIQVCEDAFKPEPLHTQNVSILPTESSSKLDPSCSYLPSDTTFTFKCPANQGGIIIPQTQVRREQTPLQDGSLENYVHRHCQNWCHFLKRKTPPKESF
ncbi:hypothetical protein H0H93_000508, partial [Arthromyces matolae]